MQVRSVHKGTNLRNSAFPYVHEYLSRLRLAKIGYVSDLSKVEAHKAEIFAIIGNEFDACQYEDMKKHRR